MTLSSDQIDKIRAVRNMGYISPLGDYYLDNQGGGFSYLGSKRALEECGWNVEDAIQLLLSNNDYGRFVIKG